MHRRRTAAAVAAGILGVAALAGCSGDDPDAAPSDGATSSGTPTTGSPSDSAPSADAATGPELSSDHVTLHAPDGWKIESDGSVLSAGPRDDADTSSITVLDSPTAGGDDSLDRLAREAIKVLGSEMKLTVQPTVEIDGVESYHVAGTFGSSTDVDQFGPPVDGAVVLVRFQLSTLTSEKKRQALIDAVLASVEWNI